MAHYALINSKDIVVQVITGVDENITQIDLDGLQVGGSSEAWEKFYETRPWFSGFYCKRTSYNNNYRKNYAGIGYTYDGSRDAFIPSKPFESWILNEDTCRWDSPISKPLQGVWKWDEKTLQWVELNGEN